MLAFPNRHCRCSTYNCLACPDNRRTYNDGYHILHHLNSRLHWSELPQRFIDTLAAHDENDGERSQDWLSTGVLELPSPVNAAHIDCLPQTSLGAICNAMHSFP